MIDPATLAVSFGEELDARDITYALTGSVAASFYGEPRSTVDIDFTVMAAKDSLARLIELQDKYYVSESAINEAVDRSSSFNLVHHETGLKIDIFVLDSSPFNEVMIERRIRMRLNSGEVWVASPEDVTARKIRWYALTDETSERQYRDIMALLSYGNVDVDEVIATAKLAGLGKLAQRLADQAQPS